MLAKSNDFQRLDRRFFTTRAFDSLLFICAHRFLFGKVYFLFRDVIFIDAPLLALDHFIRWYLIILILIDKDESRS